MRAIWSGAIGFGLVNIPVRLYSATQESRLDLDMLDKRDESHIRYARINSETGKEVPWANIVKGYKVSKGYVVLTDEDFEKVSPEKSKMIDIQEFTEQSNIPTVFYETPYYLEPSKGGEKAYVLLRDALLESGKVAIGSFVLRSRENLCLLQATEKLLLLVRLRFAEEIRDIEELKIPDKKITAAEQKMALHLIDQLTPKRFKIEAYKDTYDNELMKIIKLKAKGREVPKPEFKLVASKAKDLMAQLKASLEVKPAKKAS